MIQERGREVGVSPNRASVSCVAAALIRKEEEAGVGDVRGKGFLHPFAPTDATLFA